MEDGHPYGADAYPADDRPQELGGLDSGWHLIGRHAGYDQLDEVHRFDQAAVVGAGLAGGFVGSAGDLVRRPDLEHQLTVNGSGFPALVSGDYSSHVPLDLPAGDPRDNPVDNPPFADPQVPGYHPDRIGRLGGALDLGISGVEGFAAAKGIDDNAHHAYVLNLEENDDGRRRAMLAIYDVFESRSSGEPVIQSSYGWLDDAGKLQREPFNFRFPDQPVLTPGGVSYYQVP